MVPLPPATVAQWSSANPTLWAGSFTALERVDLLEAVETLRAVVLEGRMEPGRVFGRTVGLEDVATGYQAMADRRDVKVVVRP